MAASSSNMPPIGDSIVEETSDPTAFIGSLTCDILKELIVQNELSSDTMTLLEVGGYNSSQIENFEFSMSSSEKLIRLKELGSAYWYIGMIEERAGLSVTGNLDRLAKNFKSNRRHSIRKVWLDSIREGNLEFFRDMLTTRNQNRAITSDLLADIKLAIAWDQLEMIQEMIPLFHEPRNVLVTLAKCAIEHIPPTPETVEEFEINFNSIPRTSILVYLLNLISKMVFDVSTVIEELYLAIVDQQKRYLIPLVIDFVSDMPHLLTQVAHRACQLGDTKVCEYIATKYPDRVDDIFRLALPEAAALGKTEIVSFLIPKMSSSILDQSLIRAINSPNGPPMESIGLLLDVLQSNPDYPLKNALVLAAKKNLELFRYLINRIDLREYQNDLKEILILAANRTIWFNRMVNESDNTELVRMLSPLMDEKSIVDAFLKICSNDDIEKMEIILQLNPNIIQIAVATWASKYSNLSNIWPSIRNLATHTGAESPSYADVLIWAVSRNFPLVQAYIEAQLDSGNEF